MRVAWNSNKSGVKSGTITEWAEAGDILETGEKFTALASPNVFIGKFFTVTLELTESVNIGSARR
ncbi:hypothetical protein J6590_037481 [Homalodisca vitripennis]|nr:hypothetical protein J6590_037481 [Homalodisca vitripennis]